MTKKDFQALAQALSSARRGIEQNDLGPFSALSIVENAIVEVCKRQNPAFNVSVFRDAARAPQSDRVL